MVADTTDLTCGRCGRTASTIFHCPKLSTDCDYEVIPSPGKGKRLIYGSVIIVAAFVALFLGLWLLTLLLLAGVALIMSFNSVQLYSKRLRTRLQRTTLAGVEVNLKCDRPLPIRFELNPFPSFPLSVSALFALENVWYVNLEQAAGIFRAALLGLLASGIIEIQQFQSYSFSKWLRVPVKNTYFVAASRTKPVTGSIGKLERRIVEVLTDLWSNPVSNELPGGLTVYALVRAVYESDKAGSPRWLAKIVADDAVDRGLCQISKINGVDVRIDWYNLYLNQLSQEEKVSKMVSQRLERDYPEFSLWLDKHIPSAINSREEPEVGDGCGCGCG